MICGLTSRSQPSWASLLWIPATKSTTSTQLAGWRSTSTHSGVFQQTKCRALTPSAMILLAQMRLNLCLTVSATAKALLGSSNSTKCSVAKLLRMVSMPTLRSISGETRLFQTSWLRCKSLSINVAKRPVLDRISICSNGVVSGSTHLELILLLQILIRKAS